MLRHAAHGPLRARFPPIRHVEAVGATQVKRSPMELCKPAISLRLDSARSRHVVRFPAGPAGGLLDAAMPSLRAVPATTSHGVVSLSGLTRRVCGVGWQVVAQGAVAAQHQSDSQKTLCTLKERAPKLTGVTLCDAKVTAQSA